LIILGLRSLDICIIDVFKPKPVDLKYLTPIQLSPLDDFMTFAKELIIEIVMVGSIYPIYCLVVIIYQKILDCRNPDVIYCRQISTADYSTVTSEVTRRELRKLYKSPEYKKMFDRKGPDVSEWNWQMRDGHF